MLTCVIVFSELAQLLRLTLEGHLGYCTLTLRGKVRWQTEVRDPLGGGVSTLEFPLHFCFPGINSFKFGVPG